MKVITLLPFKNEAALLRGFMESAWLFSDEIIGIDDDSEDGSLVQFRSYGGTCLSPSFDSRWSNGGESRSRQALLDAARARGGTHIVCLDADERLSQPLALSLRSRLAELPIGGTLAARLVTLWKTPASYRRRRIVGDPPFLEFAHRDDGVGKFEGGLLHFGRIPGASVRDVTRVRADAGVILHFQFCNWRRAQLKQVWYRMMELSAGGRSALRINLRYRRTERLGLTQECRTPASWLVGLETAGPTPVEQHAGESKAESALWRQINEMFNRHGVVYFEGLEIWHLPEMHDRFVSSTGRDPRPLRVGSAMCAAADLIDASRGFPLVHRLVSGRP